MFRLKLLFINARYGFNIVTSFFFSLTYTNSFFSQICKSNSKRFKIAENSRKIVFARTFVKVKMVKFTRIAQSSSVSLSTQLDSCQNLISACNFKKSFKSFNEKKTNFPERKIFLIDVLQAVTSLINIQPVSVEAKFILKVSRKFSKSGLKTKSDPIVEKEKSEKSLSKKKTDEKSSNHYTSTVW